MTDEERSNIIPPQGGTGAVRYAGGLHEMAAQSRQIQAAVLAEREQCCRDACERCRVGYIPERKVSEIPGHQGDAHWIHSMPDGYYLCHASAIRERGAK